jgi:hypothetical protein
VVLLSPGIGRVVKYGRLRRVGLWIGIGDKCTQDLAGETCRKVAT